MRWIRCTLVPLAALAVVSAASAQTTAPAHIVLVDGAATLGRDGRPDAAIVNMPLAAGDRLRTTNGRLAILFPDGAALDVDEFTEAEITGDGAVRVTEGRALFRVPSARYEVVAHTLTTPAGSLTAARPGDYRISYPDSFDSAHADAFTAWANARQVPGASGSASAPHLPSDLRLYGPVLDQYGGWQYDPAYGYVWYPSVGPSWRPYSDGYWAPIRPYGWTWIGVDAWSWPTHHYGRWGFRRDRWFWIPGRTWAPAWVAWGASPDYVSWCPLGWDSRPVFALSVSDGDPWTGWTVLPRTSFGYARVDVGRHVVHPRELRLAAAAFALQARAPMAMPRGALAASASRRGNPPAVTPRDAPAYRADSMTPGLAVPRGAPPREEREPATRQEPIGRPHAPADRHPPASGAAAREKAKHRKGGGF